MRTTYEYELTAAEGIAAIRFNSRRMIRQVKVPGPHMALVLAGIAAWIMVGISFGPVLDAAPAEALVWLLVAIGLQLIRGHYFSKQLFAYMAGKSGALSGRRTLTLEAQGFRVSLPRSECMCLWSGIVLIETLPGQTLIYVDHVSYVSVADSAFESAEDKNIFWAHVRSCMEAAPNKELLSFGTAATPSLQPVDTAVPAKSALQIFGANLALGLRMAFFLPPRMQLATFSWGQFLALSIAMLLLPLAIEFAQIGTAGSFVAYAIPDVLFLIPLVIAASWGLACLGQQRTHASELTIALLAMTVLMAGAEPLLQAAYTHFKLGESSNAWLAWLGWFAYYAMPIWLTLAAAVAAIRFLDAPPRMWFAAFVIAGVVLFLPFTYVYRQAALWVVPYSPDAEADDSDNEYRALQREDNFYLQQQVLDQALARLQAGRKGVVDLYFIGVAGYASQDVFMKEINGVEQLFEQRFHTAGRSIVLINNPKTLATAPIASGTSLKRSLQRVATLMNKDEDVLFLFMTSHGSRDHKFSLRFGSMRFNDLDPARLRQLLDESGIKRRVVVVSACYSGGFVEALKDDNTLVIAAAAPDKNSFGCSNENEFTYFGKAYFDEALRQTYSFAEAFEIAKPVIAKREAEQEYTPSDPRMSMGKDIAPVLDAYAKRMGASKQAPPI